MRPGEAVPIDRITVEEGRRDSLGDLTGLMESLKTTGLIHPIVVTDDLHSIAERIAAGMEPDAPMASVLSMPSGRARR
jgi:hypothetical protein